LANCLVNLLLMSTCNISAMLAMVGQPKTALVMPWEPP
jgi:hypothetical protein